MYTRIRKSNYIVESINDSGLLFSTKAKINLLNNPINKMKKSILLTNNGLELECLIIFDGKTLSFDYQEVMVYCQNKLVKGLLFEDYVAELETFCDWCIIPEFQEELYETKD